MRSRLSQFSPTKLSAALATTAAALAIAYASPVVAESATPSQDDLKALIYFMSQGDQEAVEAETRRLQSIYPGWTPSDQIEATEQSPSGDDIDAVYERIATKDLDGARDVIDALSTTFASWTPPEDMISLLETAEGQRAFDKAIEANDEAAATRILGERPNLSGCDRVNNIWRLADLQAADGDLDSALTAHRGVVEGCDDVDLVIASLEKASADAKAEELKDLTATATERFPGEKETFAALEERLLAGMGAAPPASSGAITATPRVATPVVAPKTATRPARTTGKSGARALATLPAKGDERIDRVREAARQFRWTACLERSSRPQSLDVLYERSWCNMNKERPMEALVGFQAVADTTSDARVLRDARFGQALAYLARGVTNEAAVIAADAEFTQAQRREIESKILEQRAVRSFENGRYRHAVAYLDALDGMNQEMQRDLDMLRGWSLLNAGFAKRAHDEFSRLHDEIKTQDTIQALRAASSKLSQ